jgi:hypothetical protein
MHVSQGNPLFLSHALACLKANKTRSYYLIDSRCLSLVSTGYLTAGADYRLEHVNRDPQTKNLSDEHR